MNQIIINDFQDRVRSGELKIITATGRTTNFQEINPSGKIIAEGGFCTDPECDCHGSWYHWKES